MKLTESQHKELGDKLQQIFTELNETAFGQKANSLVTLTIHKRLQKNYFASQWFTQIFFTDSDFHKKEFLFEVINLAKEIISKTRSQIAEKNETYENDMKMVFSRFDQLQKEYEEIQKKENDSIAQQLKKIQEAQSQIIEKLQSLASEQKTIREDLSTKAEKSDLPSDDRESILGLTNKLNTVAISVENLGKTLNAQQPPNPEKQKNTKTLCGRLFQHK